jgi:hypothetical protein
MPRATSIPATKVIDEAGNITELAIWRVAPGTNAPEGVRYRLAFVRAGEAKPVVLYDNHRPKGHRRHLEGREEPHNFTGVEQLIVDFTADVRRITEGRAWRSD